MKRLVLMIIPVLICGVFLLVSSCDKENDINSALSIYAFGQSETRSAAFDESKNEIKNLWCTGNDIKWYNAATGELKFNITPPPISGFPPFIYEYLVVFLDDKELIRLETVTGISSISTARPCITWEDDGERIYKGCKCGKELDHISGPTCEPIWEYTGNSGYYISKGYPRWDPKDRDESTAHWDWDSIDAAREENWKAIESEWNIFIEQLKKEGKYRE